MKERLPFFLLTIYFLLLELCSKGQTIINGTVTDQKGDTMPFVEIFMLDNNGQKILKAMSDLDGGHFTFSLDTNIANKKIFAVWFNCPIDTFILTKNNFSNINIKIQDCLPPPQHIHCRTNYIMQGDYYVDISDFSNNELKIVTGDEIMKKEYSPYDYQLIEKEKKYKADNGQIFTGQQLIKQRKLPLQLWDKADLKPIKVEDLLNEAKREFKFCNDGNILTDWTISCASNYTIVFEQAKLIDPKLKLYELTGKVIETSREQPLVGMTINYGDIKQNTCKMDELGETDMNGNFTIAVSLNADKGIVFSSLGYKSTLINLNVDR